MEVRGKPVIILIFGTALLAAVFAWTFQFLRGRRVLELWGPDTARLVRVEADRVDLWLLSPQAEAEAGAAEPLKSIQIDGAAWDVVRSEDISQTRGLIHARQALIEDASFAWEVERGDCPPRWEFAFHFLEGDRAATVLIDTHCRRARMWESGAEASIAPIFDGLEKFIGEKLNLPLPDQPVPPVDRETEHEIH